MTGAFQRCPTRGISIVVVAALMLLLFKPFGSRAEGPVPPAAGAQQMDQLREEREETLDEASTVADRLYSHGILPFETTIRCREMLVQSKLEAAASPKERVAILADALRVAKAQEETVKRRVQAGTANALEPLEAKAYRLQTQIKLIAEAVR